MPSWRTTQHWEIVPVGKGEYSNTHAQLRLVYGGLCLSRTDAATSKSGDGDSDSRYGLTMAKCVDLNDAHELVDIPKIKFLLSMDSLSKAKTWLQHSKAQKLRSVICKPKRTQSKMKFKKTLETQINTTLYK